MRKTRMLIAGVTVAFLSVQLIACDKAGTDAESPGIILNQSPVAAPPVLDARPFVRTVSDAVGGEQDRGVNCSLDAISWRPAPEAVVLDRHTSVAFQGWAADNALGVPDKIVFLLIGKDAAFGVAGATGQSRPDVAAALKNPAFVKSGYAVDADLSDVPQGEYRAALLESFQAGERRCELSKTIAIK